MMPAIELPSVPRDKVLEQPSSDVTTDRSADELDDQSFHDICLFVLMSNQITCRTRVNATSLSIPETCIAVENPCVTGTL